MLSIRPLDQSSNVHWRKITQTRFKGFSRRVVSALKLIVLRVNKATNFIDERMITSLFLITPIFADLFRSMLKS